MGGNEGREKKEEREGDAIIRLDPHNVWDGLTPIVSCLAISCPVVSCPGL